MADAEDQIAVCQSSRARDARPAGGSPEPLSDLGRGAGLPDEAGRVRRRLAELQAKLKPPIHVVATYAYERTRPDGAVLEIRPSPIAGGGVVRTYTDITQRKRAEEKFRWPASKPLRTRW
jgi:hypothetical protein